MSLTSRRRRANHRRRLAARTPYSSTFGTANISESERAYDTLTSTCGHPTAIEFVGMDMPGEVPAVRSTFTIRPGVRVDERDGIITITREKPLATIGGVPVFASDLTNHVEES